MNKSHKEKLVISLMILILLFAIVFFFSFLNLKNGTSFLNIGLKPQIESSIIMLLSLLSIIKVFFELKGV